jgi:hypothetical protein
MLNLSRPLTSTKPHRPFAAMTMRVAGFALVSVFNTALAPTSHQDWEEF